MADNNQVQLPANVSGTLKLWGPIVLAVLGAVGVTNATSSGPAPTREEFATLQAAVEKLPKKSEVEMLTSAVNRLSDRLDIMVLEMIPKNK